MSVRVKLKITHDPDWQISPRFRERYWVYLPDGQYFPIFKGAGDHWHQLYAQHLNYPSMDAAIADSLRYIYAKVDKTEQWRKCRARIQVFTFNARNHSQLAVPRKRSLPKPKFARQA